jgi:hypothetical protein
MQGKQMLMLMMVVMHYTLHCDFKSAGFEFRRSIMLILCAGNNGDVSCMSQGLLFTVSNPLMSFGLPSLPPQPPMLGLPS